MIRPIHDKKLSGRMSGLVLAVALAALLLPVHGQVWGHAFVKRSEPRSDATLREAPAAIRIWFDTPVERVFIRLRVENENKQRVDKGNARVNAEDARIIEVELPAIPPGTYRVIWGVIARDGHPRSGGYQFRVYQIDPIK